jgi:glucosamine--fructose-6-phosphate aminotransferase (isomerizing)
MRNNEASGRKSTGEIAVPDAGLTDQTDTASDAASTLMYAEAADAANAVTRFLDLNAPAIARLAERLRRRPPKFVTTCARGSSDFAATFAKYLIETLIGVPTSSAAPSVASLFGASVRAEDCLCLAISQSGRSPDLLRTVEAYRNSGAYVVALVNDAASPLASLADDLLPLHAGPELSVAATKSYIVSLVGVAALVAAWAGDTDLENGLRALPGRLGEAFAHEWPAAQDLLQHATNLFVLSRGYGLAVAQEAALKLKETCGLHAEAFSTAEVRHGPMAIVGPGFPVLAFATSDAAGDDVRGLVREFRGRGAQVELLCAATNSTSSAESIHPALEPILQVQAFYRLVNALSVARGFNPDKPRHLNKITKTL